MRSPISNTFSHTIKDPLMIKMRKQTNTIARTSTHNLSDSILHPRLMNFFTFLHDIIVYMTTLISILWIFNWVRRILMIVTTVGVDSLCLIVSLYGSTYRIFGPFSKRHPNHGDFNKMQNLWGRRIGEAIHSSTENIVTGDEFGFSHPY